jgi:catechol 2,3-dioxygenase-like lactoylglutathione lyase family enzyme
MIFGAHIVLYSKDADADRAFFRHILGLKSVDAGRGWLIFALPPAEAAFHPAEDGGTHELFFTCDALQREMAALAAKNVEFSEIQEARWGSIVKMPLPGGSNLSLYQPRHELALDEH